MTTSTSKLKRIGDYVRAGGPKVPKSSSSRIVGMELELEGVTNVMVPTKNEDTFPIVFNGETEPVWFVKKDGSLRNGGAEFITSPVPHDSLGLYVQRLLTLNDGNWKASERCGLHLHVNMRDFFISEVRAMLTAYTLMEPALFNAVGGSRDQSIYCIPYYRGPEEVMKAIDCLAMEYPISALSRACNKYSALYLEPLCRFGSVEFRHAPAWLDVQRICDWADICVNLVDFSKGKSAQQMIDLWNMDWMSFYYTSTGLPVDPNYFENYIEKLDCDYLAQRIAQDEEDTKDIGWERVVDTLGMKKSSTARIPMKKKTLGSPFLAQIMSQQVPAQEAQPLPGQPVPIDWESSVYEALTPEPDFNDDEDPEVN